MGDLRGLVILVTGATGFIGATLCRRLREAGAEVHAVSRTQRSVAKRGLRWWKADLSQQGKTQRLCRMIKPDVIFHLASHVIGARNIENVAPTFQNNLMTTVNLLTVASEVGCQRIILSNSLEEPDRADTEPVPCSPYAAAKWASSAYARMFHALYQVPVSILRLFMVYGPGQRDLNKLVPHVTMSLLRGEAPKLTTGQRQIDWIYVDDVVDGMLAAAKAPGIEGKTIDIGSGGLTSIREVVDELVQLVNPEIKPLFGALAERPLEQTRVADTTEASASLGWKPKTPLRQGLERTVEWYRSTRTTASAFLLNVLCYSLMNEFIFTG